MKEVGGHMSPVGTKVDVVAKTNQLRIVVVLSYPSIRG